MATDGPGRVMQITRTIPYQQADRKNGARLYFRLPLSRGIPIVLHFRRRPDGDRWAHCVPFDLTPLTGTVDGIENLIELGSNNGAEIGKCRPDVEIKIVDAMLSAGEAFYGNNFKNANGSFRPLLIPHSPSKIRMLTKGSKKKAERFYQKAMFICAAYLAALEDGSDDRQLILDTLASVGIRIKSKRDLNKCLSRLELPSLREALS